MTGTASAFAVQGDDPYVDGTTTTLTITDTLGGNYELLATGDTALVTVEDTIDTTTVTIDDVTVEEGTGTATLTASVDNAPETDLTITLSNGATVTILAGQLTGTSSAFAVQGDDPYVDGTTTTLTITGTLGGNYEQLATGDTALVTVEDTIDTTTVTIDDVTVDRKSGAEGLRAGVGSAPETDLTITLSNGATVTILAGETTATASAFAVQGDDPYVDGTTTTLTITGTLGGNYEQLATGDTALVTVEDTIDTTTVTIDDVTVEEGTGTATLTASVDNAPNTDLTI